MAAETLPLWVWNLVIAIQRHEAEHAEGQCLDGVLRAVPADVAAQAAAIDSYIRATKTDAATAHAEKQFGSLVAGFFNPRHP